VEELFQLPSEAKERWRALVPRLEYLVDDLTTEREEALKARTGPPLVRLALLLLRYGRAEELAGHVEGWKALFAEVHATPEGLEQLRAVVHYLLKVGDKAVRAPIRRVIEFVAVEQRAEELMTSIADEFIEQGWVKGQARGRAEFVLRILATRGIDVDEGARQLILACTDLDTLDRWFDRALNATSFSDLRVNG
jgi:hypothetical protein